MEPLGIIIFALLLALVLIAIIVPQVQKRQQSESSQ